MIRQRTSSNHVRFASYNLLDYGLLDSPDELQRRELVHETIRSTAADVVAVQELRAEGPEEGTRAAALLRELAEATGMSCELPDGSAAVALGNVSFHVGLLWNPAIEAVSWRTWSGRQFWHSCGRVVLDVGGPLVGHAAFHNRPFGRYARADETERFASVLLRPHDGYPTIAGLDGNVTYAWRNPDGSWYDPDPFAGQPVNRDTIHQCTWTYDETGERVFAVDRGPGEILAVSGLIDAAFATGAPYAATTGHWFHDQVDRRIDAILGTPEFASAFKSYAVDHSDLAKKASDHLDISADYDAQALCCSP
ncbi:endonuclease/exonuclease/phosphatase family protein [Nocardia miyunensis]|uniref:endonuclease/exonuclease/phosphatase family protein n=1 Tax=Nocardia miyunensis TaxID=282684 RepID=UPI000836BAED|nr:endonuclease/exonuclease/phosphatase family protein [Nocardia miyunensis]